MSFKEYIEHDLHKTFMDVSEFAESKKINGVDVLVVEDSDKLEQRIKTDYNGLVVGNILFYITDDEYRKIPRVSPIPTAGMALRYGEKHATVINVGGQDGLYEFILDTAGGR